MASANRSSRFSPRTSSPFPSQNTRSSVQQNIPSVSRKRAGSNGWVEPPLRPPVPSFMDHKGLERQGVLEQMVALGTPPTAKVKARSKGDPVRRTVQARNLEDMVVDDTRATPDFMINSVSGLTRTPSMSGREATRGMGSFEPANRHMASISHPIFPPPDSAHSRSTSSLQNTPLAHLANDFMSPSISSDPFEKALNHAAFMAVQNGRHDIEQGILSIRTAAREDPEFATLLNFAVTNNSLDERGSAVNRKLKQLKTNLRSQPSSPHNNHGSRSGVSLSHPSVSPSQPQFRTIGHTNNKINHSSTNFSKLNSATSPSPQRQSATRFSSRSLSTANGIAKTSMGSLPNLRQEKASSLSRRSSSSSLSSVDEGLAAGPPPSLDLLSSTAKLNSLHETSILDQNDIEIEAKKVTMKKQFEDVEVVESNERPAKPTMSDSSQGKPMPRLRLKGPSELHRNGTAAGIHVSLDSDMFAVPSASLKRKATPPPTPTNLGRPPKKLKTAAKIKMSPQKNQQPAVIAGIARPQNKRHTSVGLDDQRSEQSDNNDFCFTCSGTGYLLCCDGCDRAFHFSCLDPPLDETTLFDGPWLCHACKGERGLEQPTNTGIFAELQNRIMSKNPTSFILPEAVRDYFEGVQTGANGEYVETADSKTNNTKGRIGYDETPNFQKLRDDKGNFILCYYCHESSLGQRDIIACDYCDQRWHLDCLNPPLANPPNRSQNGKSRPKWRCPLHTEHDLKQIDPLENNGVLHNGFGRTHKVRRPKNVTIVTPTLRRGFKNNGVIEIGDEFESMTEPPDAVIYRLQPEGIKLDFIDRVKSLRRVNSRAVSSRAYGTQLNNEDLEHGNNGSMTSDLMRHSLKEQIAALNLAQLSSNQGSIDVGSTRMDDLIYTVLAEAPGNVRDLLGGASSKPPDAANGSDSINGGEGGEVDNDDAVGTVNGVSSNSTAVTTAATTTTLSSTQPKTKRRQLTPDQRQLAKLLVRTLQAALGEDEHDEEGPVDAQEADLVNGD